MMFYMYEEWGEDREKGLEAKHPVPSVLPLLLTLSATAVDVSSPLGLGREPVRRLEDHLLGKDLELQDHLLGKDLDLPMGDSDDRGVVSTATTAGSSPHWVVVT